MKVKIENLKDSQKLIRIEVEPERVDSALNGIYDDIQKRARIPGYRQGKAPRDLIEAHYNKGANEEALSHLIWECYHQAVKEQALDPVGYPVIQDVDFNKGKPLVYTAKVDVKPEFKLKDYKGIKVKERPYDVTDDDIEKAIKGVQESMAQYKNIEPRKVAMGDYIICDYECFDDGKLVDKNDKLWLYISEQLEPKELLNALVGTELGTTKEVEVAYPQSYQYKELAGKNRVYKVTPKQIKEKILPDINDDLAKETGHFSDLNGLREHLRKVIYSTKKRESQADVESQIFNTLLKNHVFEIPSSMVERQAAQLAEDAKHQLLHQGYKKEDLEKEDGKIKEGVKSQAKNNVKLFFIIEKIARSENINITDEELDEKIDQIAKSTKEPTAEVRKKLDENGLIENLREQMLHDKVVEFLIKEADRAKP